MRQVITRRLSRLSADANKIMAAASAFSGGFNFLTLSLVTGLEEGATLDAIDEALETQLLQPTGQLDHYDFTHALIRHTLYSEMNPSRQVRLHRQIAEAYEQRNQDQAAKERHAAEMAYQYHRSAAIPGAERGVEYALLAADRAEAAYAHDEAAQFLRIALDLCPRMIPRGRAFSLGSPLPSRARCGSTNPCRSLSLPLRASRQLKVADAAAAFLADASFALSTSGSLRSAWQVSAAGVPYAQRGSHTWARLVYGDVQQREAMNPNTAGTSMPLDAPEYEEFVAAVRAARDSDEATMFVHEDRRMPSAARTRVAGSQGPRVQRGISDWLSGRANTTAPATCSSERPWRTRRPGGSRMPPA